MLRGPALITGIVGISGGAAYFSWVHPLSPYLFGFAFIFLGYSFYKAYLPADRYGKPQEKEKDSCPNCQQEKQSFLKSKIYVWLVALFVAVMFTINYFPNLILS